MFLSVRQRSPRQCEPFSRRQLFRGPRRQVAYQKVAAEEVSVFDGPHSTFDDLLLRDRLLHVCVMLGQCGFSRFIELPAHHFVLKQFLHSLEFRFGLIAHRGQRLDLRLTGLHLIVADRPVGGQLVLFLLSSAARLPHVYFSRYEFLARGLHVAYGHFVVHPEQLLPGLDLGPGLHRQFADRADIHRHHLLQRHAGDCGLHIDSHCQSGHGQRRVASQRESQNNVEGRDCQPANDAPAGCAGTLGRN